MSITLLILFLQERTEDWIYKFSKAGFKCSELTSDTAEDLDWRQINSSHILLCTPEKWDQFTRKDRNSGLGNKIGLVLLDEIHVIAENRGACLEAVITRMKLWSYQKRATGEHEIRFIAVSATCPNLEVFHFHFHYYSHSFSGYRKVDEYFLRECYQEVSSSYFFLIVYNCTEFIKVWKRVQTRTPGIAFSLV